MPDSFNRNQEPQVCRTQREQVAERFRLWEIRGRGWQIFDYEIELEPVFPRFIPSRRATKPTDDGRIPTMFSRLFSSLNNVKLLSDDNFSPESSENCHPSSRSYEKTVSFRIHLPNELKITSEQMEQLLLNLASPASFIGFEIIGTVREILLQIVCPETQKSTVFSLLKNHLPTVDFRETEDALCQNLLLDRTNKSVTIDFGLRREWFIPLPQGKSFATDTLLPLIAAVEELAEGETVCLQILFSRACGNWQQGVQETIFDRAGKPVFANLNNYLTGIKEKLSNQLLAAVVRLAAQSNSKERSQLIAQRTSAFFRQFSSPYGNDLIPLKKEGLAEEKHLQSVLKKTSYRGGMLLSPAECSSIFHFPSDAIKSPKLQRDENRTKAAPEFATRGNIILGENHHGGQTKIIKLSDEQRLKHIWITGASGCGKSTLITQIAEQDAKAGHGFCIIEPHDLINEVIARIPENRLCDCILFDPTDEEPVGFNPLQSNSELEKTLLSSDLAAIFQKFWTSPGDIMSNVLHNSILAFLSSTKGETLVDLKHFLVNKEFRHRFLETVADEEIRFYWQNEFPSLAKRITPLLTRLDLFLRSKPIRNVIVQKDNKLDFRRIMDERKILLVKLTHGALGENNSRLIGALIIAKLYQTALSRQNVSQADRPAFFVSLDEARHYLSIPSMALLLSEGRKYRISILASHQDTQQIATSQDSDVLSSLMTNCYTRVAFRSDTDAERLSKGFSFFTADHFKNLGVGEAICRFEQSRQDFNLKIFPRNGKSWIFKPEEEWVEIPVPPIVETEVWEEVNAILSAQRTKLKRPSRKTVHLFSGTTFCYCGEKMYVPTKSLKYTCYVCRNKIPTDDLEEIFQMQLKDFFVSSKDILKYLKEADEVIKEKEVLLESLVREQNKLQTEMDKLYRLYMQDEISADGFGRNYRPLEERLEKISEQIPDLQGEIDFLKTQYLSRDEILSESKSLYDRWTDLTKEEKRTIIEQTVELVVIGENEVNIELGYVPSSYEMITKRQQNSGVSSL